MSMNRRLRYLVVALLCVAAMSISGAARAAGPDGQEGMAAGWFRHLGRFNMPGVYERNHSRVKAAFRDVVAQPNRGTLRVLCGGKTAAMGTVVDANGYVLTKASELSRDIECELQDGRQLPATVVGISREYDLALLKVEAADLIPVAWNAQDLTIGTLLATPGPGRLPAAIGVVSALPRAIAPSRAVLGIKLSEAPQGARVAEVFDGSGAADAGIRVGDVITHLNGRKLADHQALIEAISDYQPGDRVQVAVLRADRQHRLAATLGSLDQLVHEELAFQNGLGGPISQRRAGFPRVLQHDTVLRPSDCGGPLVDLDGKVVGINIARAGRVASYAIPASAILPLLGELKSGRLAPETLPELAEQPQVAEQRGREAERVSLSE